MVKSCVVFVCFISFMLYMYSFVVLLCAVITQCESKAYMLGVSECVLYRLYFAYTMEGVLIFKGVVLVSFLLCFLSLFYIVFVVEKRLILYGCFLKALLEVIKGVLVL